MTTDSRVISELRDMFRAGATPSRLIDHVIDRHGNSNETYSLIQSYFEEAFEVPLVRVSKAILERPKQDDLQYAHLNFQLLHQMLLHRNTWDDRTEVESKAEPVWYDPVEVTDRFALIEKARGGNYPELDSVWDKLDPHAKQYIFQLVGSVNICYESAILLTRLCEQLQQRLNELETRDPAAITCRNE